MRFRDQELLEPTVFLADPQLLRRHIVNVGEGVGDDMSEELRRVARAHADVRAAIREAQHADLEGHVVDGHIRFLTEQQNILIDLYREKDIDEACMDICNLYIRACRAINTRPMHEMAQWTRQWWEHFASTAEGTERDIRDARMLIADRRRAIEQEFDDYTGGESDGTID